MWLIYIKVTWTTPAPSYHFLFLIVTDFEPRKLSSLIAQVVKEN